jgi:hypothetical protein
MSRKQNVSMFRGEDKVLSVTVDNGATPPVAVNITGWTLSFTLRLTAGDATALVTKTTASGISLTAPLTGVLQVLLEDVDTVALSPGKYAYDVKRMDAGAEAVLVYGTLTLLPEVTR